MATYHAPPEARTRRETLGQLVSLHTVLNDKGVEILHGSDSPKTKAHLAASHLELGFSVGILLNLNHYAITPVTPPLTRSVLSSGRGDKVANVLDLLGLHNRYDHNSSLGNTDSSRRNRRGQKHLP